MEGQYTIIQAVADSLGRSETDTETLLRALCAEITRALSNAETVALPGFGSFCAEKVDEHVSTDLSTGKSMLMPPVLEATFKPGSRLLKTISK
ncbi:MAG: HU family DNA-binding protein [Muribaculum sp.]|nr:HU family DNA-binding protein [Muribaculaceae bacterium]MCM1080354.1 HU family DNA-binding protein [Muribaculum sp.]